MAYSTANPPALFSQAVGGRYRKWVYKSTDAQAAVAVTGYITNAGSLGMKVGDTVEAINTATNLMSMHTVVTVNATTGAADLSDGTAIGGSNAT